MPDFLLELRSEEIPARMQAKAEADLARLFAEQLGAAGLYSQGLTTYATPRRLALIAHGLPDQTAPTREETKGPRSAAPPQALEGFLRKTGLTRDQLEERDGIFFAVVEKPGRLTREVLAEAIPAIIRAFPWPKSMRWGAASTSTESIRWVRPLQGIVALFGEEIVPVEVAGVNSGAATVGHRFHHPGIITIGSSGDYVEKLRACRVIVDAAERRRIIAEGAAAAARDAGLELVEDEGLLHENAGLTEWPVPLLGSFDPAFLEVPPEVIQLTMRTNQKYFALQFPGEGSRLAPNFICVANIDAADGGAAIVQGNQKVLAARLSDAKFFWEQDLKVPLEQQAQKLAQIVFHEKLGTVADKVDRVAKLARWLVEEGIVTTKSSPGRGGEPRPQAVVEGAADARSVPPVDHPLHHASGMVPFPTSGEDQEDFAALAERAARLCKADLVTAMVGEFPELQGVIGGYLASAQGEHPAVAAAIRDHYKPVGQGDEVPTAPATVAVSLADKLDTVISFFAAEMAPTGSKDPFALRRAMISLQALTERNLLRFSFDTAVTNVLDAIAPKEDTGRRWIWGHEELTVEQKERYDRKGIERQGLAWSPQTLVDEAAARSALASFFADRLKVQQREAGVRHDLIDAVFALGGEDDLVRLLARVRALQAFVETAEGADLLAGYKRAANILKKEGWGATATHRPGLDPGQGLSSPEGQEEGSPAPDQVRGDAESAGRSEALSYTPLSEEAALIAALESAEPRARAAVEAEDFEGAMAALATLRGPVDAFFDKVTVNDPDRDKRAARLALLARMRDAVHQVADFSRIEG